ncbi:MAG: hypothetical protein LBF77_07745 [Spirochaetaceae bacterium]|jgi:hypothetical protein|nr:hypothetical protein [Spirochaetaceae bacterium]
MSKGLKPVILGAAAAFIVTAVPLAAQNINEIGPQGGIPAPSSNTSRATAGRIGADIDNYMNYFNYVLPKFDSMFGFGGYGLDGSSIYRDASGEPLVHYSDTEGNPVEEYFNLAGKIQAGYAVRRGGFYLGAWYKGNVAAAGKASIELAKQSDSTTGALEIEEVAVDSLWTDNQLQLLFGFAGMGIKLGFQEKLESRSYPVPSEESWTLSTSASGELFKNRIDEYSFLNGTMIANLGWGMPMAIGYMTLCPFLELSLHIYQDNSDQLILNYYSDDGSPPKRQRSGKGWNAGYYAPEVNIGFTLELPDLNGGTWIPGVSYNLFLPLYNNSYDVDGITGTVNGAAAWTTFEEDQAGEITVTTIEISDMYHRLTPSFSYIKSFIERLQLGFSVKAPVSFGYRVEKPHRIEKGVDGEPELTSIADTTITLIEARPEIGLGAAFQAMPDALNLQVGFSLAINYKGAWEKGPGKNTLTSIAQTTGIEERTLTTHELSPLEGRVSAGFSLNFSPEFALDAAFSTGTGGDFSLTASEFSLLFVLKK